LCFIKKLIKTIDKSSLSKIAWGLHGSKTYFCRQKQQQFCKIKKLPKTASGFIVLREIAPVCQTGNC